MSSRRVLKKRLAEKKGRVKDLNSELKKAQSKVDEIHDVGTDSPSLMNDLLRTIKLNRLDITSEQESIHNLEDTLAGLNQSSGQFGLNTVLAILALIAAGIGLYFSLSGNADIGELQDRIETLEQQ